MQIKRIESIKDPAKGAVDLGFSSSGLDITVAAGSAVLNGVTHTLDEDFTATIAPDSTHTLWLSLYLVKEISSGDMVVFLDEILEDGVDMPYDWKQSTAYELLYMLASVQVAAGAADLDDAPADVWAVVAPPEEE